MTTRKDLDRSKGVFICAGCGGTFELDPDPNEGLDEELKENFPGCVPSPDDAIVCDSCYEKILAGYRAKLN